MCCSEPFPQPSELLTIIKSTFHAPEQFLEFVQIGGRKRKEKIRGEEIR